VTQLSLLADVQRADRPWKRTTTTSKAAVRVLEASGEAERRRAVCSRGLRSMWNRHQEWPTADELAADLHRRRLIPSKHRDEVAPRLNELADGWWVTRRVDGQKVRTQVGGGEVERGEKRPSRISGRTVLTWRVREAGS
jgi:hypothetical protein